MKTTTDNHIDKLLHEAMKQRAAKVPPLADDFAEKVLGSLTPRPLQKKRELKFWPLVVAACMVGFVVIFLAPPKRMNATARQMMSCHGPMFWMNAKVMSCVLLSNDLCFL